MRKLIIAALVAACIFVGALAEAIDPAYVEELEKRIEELEAELAEYKGETPEAAAAAATFAGGEITVEEARAEYEYREYFYSSMGMDIADYDDTIKQEILENLAEEAVLRQKADEYGVYEPSAEQLTALDEQAQAEFEAQVQYYIPYFYNAELTEDEIRADVIEYLESEDYTLAGVTESLKAQSWKNRLLEAVTGGIELTEADIRAYYDEAVQSAEMSFEADVQDYEYSRYNNELVLYDPEGFRRVKLILIAFDEATQEQYDELSEQLETAEGEAANAILDEMQKLYDKLTPIADEVMSRIEAGDDFMLLIDEYGADVYMDAEPGRSQGYYVSAQSTLYEESFVETAMALKNVGDVSEVGQCADGLYIIKYEGDVTPGAVPYDDIKDSEELKAAAEARAKETAYYDTVEEWLAEADIKYYPENF